MERRHHTRVNVELRCSLAAPRKKSRSFVGTTDNVSRSGVLVRWNPEVPAVELPRVGELLTVELELPANHAFGPKCMQCQATVVRVSTAENDAPRVALRVHQMKFRSFARGKPAALEAGNGVDSRLLM